MKLGSALACAAAIPQPEDFAHFAQDVAPARIEEALADDDTATARHLHARRRNAYSSATATTSASPLARRKLNV
jgi:hypothetical protein